MINNKLSAQLQLALRYESLFNDDIKSLYNSEEYPGLWEIVMEYTGNLKSIKDKFDFPSRDLKGGFAQIFIPKDQVGALSDLPQVVYLEFPTRYEYISLCLGQIGGSNLFGETSSFNVTGQGVLLAVIDSGINYSHPTFRNEDGTTRIQYLWDQTLPGDKDVLRWGQVFDKQQINSALEKPTKEEQLAIVPSQDVTGHGTALASIAGGNGRGSVAQKNRGIAPECELIIVKIGKQGTSSAPRDVEIMAGIDFCLEKAQDMGMPITLLIGVGNNLTGHDGNAVLERYITQRSNSWLSNFVVGTGNEGDKGAHASGRVEEGQTQQIELLMEGDKVSYGCCLWKNFSDSFTFEIEAPNGEATDELSLVTPNRAYLFDQTAVLINFSEPTITMEMQQIFILFQGQGGAAVNKGVWRFSITGNNVLRGEYNIWGSIVREPDDRTRFLSADLDTTLTSPATVSQITAASAFNGRTLQLAPFSGRGFTADNRVKPDLAAPGVSVIAAAGDSDGYTNVTGSSIAGAFIAGAYVLMMSYGILQLGNVNLYGETLKLYLLRSAKRPSAFAPYPNESWGYGTLCIESALNLMKQVSENTK